jgi:hypothetical protein
MGASYDSKQKPVEGSLVSKAFLSPQNYRVREAFPGKDFLFNVPTSSDYFSPSKELGSDSVPVGSVLRHVQDRADIDISGPEFNFVRSIRVFHVRFASQRRVGENDQCRRYASVRLGTYKSQGEFSWANSAHSALPYAHIGLERFGMDCPSLFHRSVFVDWRDFDGNYGFEQVNY